MTGLEGLSPDVVKKMANLRLLCLDVDGVLTDGRLFFTEQGEFGKVFHVRDGYGLKRLRGRGVELAVISARNCRVVERRLRELGIAHVYGECDDKGAAFEKLCESLDCPLERAAYMGDDGPDLPAVQKAGLGFCPADAEECVRGACDVLSRRPGGAGAVRDICEYILLAKDRGAA